MALFKLKEFCIPESALQVDACMAKYGDNALILAGGTFIKGLEARSLLSDYPGENIGGSGQVVTKPGTAVARQATAVRGVFSAIIPSC